MHAAGTITRWRSATPASRLVNMPQPAEIMGSRTSARYLNEGTHMIITRSLALLVIALAACAEMPPEHEPTTNAASDGSAKTKYGLAVRYMSRLTPKDAGKPNLLARVEARNPDYRIENPQGLLDKKCHVVAAAPSAVNRPVHTLEFTTVAKEVTVTIAWTARPPGDAQCADDEFKAAIPNQGGTLDYHLWDAFHSSSQGTQRYDSLVTVKLGSPEAAEMSIEPYRHEDWR
jgi:hypothetical protein